MLFSRKKSGLTSSKNIREVGYPVSDQVSFAAFFSLLWAEAAEHVDLSKRWLIVDDSTLDKFQCNTLKE